MLVLSRKPGQKVVIPSIDAVIEVLEIKGNTVRLGIKAPRHVSVVREELLQKMEAEIPSIDDDNSVLV
jgi:carbon storage regulator